MNNERFLNFYKELIKINSISSEIAEEDISNEKVIDLLSQWLSNKGFAVHKSPVKESRNKFNLVAKYGQGTGGLAFSGHTDTVPTDTKKWVSNPFDTNIRDGKLYGLGTIDMKGFFAFVMEVLSEIDLSKLKKTIWVIATADEETTMSGAQQIMHDLENSSDKPELIVIGEPTSMKPVIMHKGQLVQTITVHGKSGHASNPDAGLSAIKILHECMSQLYKMEEDLKHQWQEKLFSVPYPTLNIGEIRGGDAPNKISDFAEMIFEVRPIPGLKSTDLRKMTQNYLEPVIKKYPSAINIADTYTPVEAFGNSQRSNTSKIIEDITHSPALAVNYATEASYLQNICETIVMGPGDIGMAHQPNEYLNLEEVDPAIEIMNSLISSFCN